MGGALNGSRRSHPTREISSRILVGGVQSRYGSIHERLQSTPKAASYEGRERPARRYRRAKCAPK